MNKFKSDVRVLISKFPFSNDKSIMKLFTDIHDSKNDYKIAEHVFSVNSRRGEFTHEKLLATIFRDILTNRYLFESIVEEANDKVLHRRIPKTLIMTKEFDKIKIPDTETLELYIEYVLSRIDISKMDARYKKYIFGVAKNYLNESFNTSGMGTVILKLNRKQSISNIEYRIMEVGCVDKYIDALVDHVGFNHPNPRLKELMCGYRFGYPTSKEIINTDDLGCEYLNLIVRLKVLVEKNIKLIAKETRIQYNEFKKALRNIRSDNAVDECETLNLILYNAFEYLNDDIVSDNINENIKARGILVGISEGPYPESIKLEDSPKIERFVNNMFKYFGLEPDKNEEVNDENEEDEEDEYYEYYDQDDHEA